MSIRSFNIPGDSYEVSWWDNPRANTREYVYRMKGTTEWLSSDKFERYIVQERRDRLMSTGRKDDTTKPRLDLVLGDFALALQEVGKVGTIGATKYDDSNWLKVDNGLERYASAMLRHYLESKTSPLDTESGRLHVAHMAWNALAVLELTLREMNKDDMG
jgi:Domain of unknown function (DUF5664)